MAIHNFFILLFLSIVHAQNYCPPSYCNNNSLAIRSPFWLKGEQLQPNCQPIGFTLSCDGQKKAILNIPYSGDFYVNSIYYYSKRIDLSDPDKCLVRRVLSMNLSSSPFKFAYYQNYTFLSCPKGQGSSSYVVDCLSNTTTDIVATKKEANAVIFPKCKKIITLPVPVSSFFDYGFPVNLELTWDDPPIGAENKRPASRIVALSFVILSMVVPVVIVGISCCICIMKRDDPRDSGPNQTLERAGISETVTPGLGISTIETYRKITVGESRRIEGPNDVTCAICLADYVPQDIIRFLPECQHCFHVKCIDQWLSIKDKCPICRTSQA